MKFGGHETFFLRPNWLTKGLLLVKSSEDLIWNSDAASDAMGVGRNMSKSIGWWLGRAGLAHRPARGEMIVLTPFGEAVLAHDRHLTQTATLWLLHLHMCLRGEDDIFAWFFRHARDRRFSRDSLEGALRLHLEQAGDKPPAPKTLKRDVAVLLQTYARSISPRPIDPEDNLDCPLRRLGLVVHRSDLDVFERRDSTTALAPEVVASAICSLRTNTTSEFVTIVMDDMAAVRTLARVLGRDTNTLAELVAFAASTLEADLLDVRHLAGTREVRVRNLPPGDWLGHHIRRTSPQSPVMAEETCAP